MILYGMHPLCGASRRRCSPLLAFQVVQAPMGLFYPGLFGLVGPGYQSTGPNVQQDAEDWSYEEGAAAGEGGCQLLRAVLPIYLNHAADGHGRDRCLWLSWLPSRLWSRLSWLRSLFEQQW